jgi:SAM-dependent methyltransferase
LGDGPSVAQHFVLTILAELYNICMPLEWMDVSGISFNALLLLERVQLGWLSGWGLPEPELNAALRANPAVEWYLRHKCPALRAWLDRVLAAPPAPIDPRAAERAVLERMVDLLVYALDPAVYDAQPFLNWDSAELTGLTAWAGKTVLDIGAGTGRLALAAAQAGAHTVFAVEPVANLRAYLQEKAQKLNLSGVYAVDGLITAIPFPDGFADVTMGGHVFGDEPEREAAELERVTRPGGMVILCPANNDQDNEIHAFLTRRGYQWGRYEEPRDGMKRKYWRQIP